MKLLKAIAISSTIGLLVASNSIVAQTTTSGAPPYAAPNGNVSTLFRDPPRFHKDGKVSRSISNLYKQGIRSLSKNDFRRAIEKFEAALDYAPNNADLNYALGATFYLVKKDQQAATLLNKALLGLSADQKTIAEKMLSEIS